MNKVMMTLKSLAQRAGLVAAATVICLVAVAGTAFAYFTDYVAANGSKTLNLEYSTETKEELDGLDKHITMTNTGNTEVFVRVQLFYGEGSNQNVTVTVPGEGTGEGWSQDAADSHVWNYAGTLAPGQSTSQLVVDVTANETIKDYNIVVIGQTSPVLYDENNDPYPSIWSDEDQSEQN